MRQVVNAPVGNPRHAGTDEGDRSLVGGKGSVVRAPRRQPEAVREIESRSPSLARSPCPPRSLLQPRHPPSSFPVFKRPASTFDSFVPLGAPPYRRNARFPARSHCPSAFPFFFFSPLPPVSLYWQQPPTPSRFYTGKSIQPYVRLAGASAVLVHGFRNLLQLDRITGAIVPRG